MPIDYSEYPDGWKTIIVPRILNRAGEVRDDSSGIIHEAKCEWCKVENHAKGYRDVTGKFWLTADWLESMDTMSNSYFEYLFPNKEYKQMTIVLTIAHLDHDHRNESVKDERLVALCQRCHLNYDRPYHNAVRKQNIETRKGPLLGLET